MVDRYTKAVLTVIAVALVWIAAALTTAPTAQATQKREAAPPPNPIDVNIVSIGGAQVTPRQAAGLGPYSIPVIVYDRPR